ncbi:serine hydrolase domain-containing protein [Breoghania sp. L-A4]|uniref:serine hydrolase domain-containing protein n=1 Tax=Breoghania sp. L-A4 TaxID=2304600 RepID=UPI001967E7FF|nr:serine hydrolase domain-containing protein [Breoghania sp. L-A4]
MRIIAGASLFLVAPGAMAQPDDITGYLDGIRVEYGLPALAAAVVRDGAVVAVAAVGTRVHGEQIPVRLDDRFHLGSNTKAMTATLAGMMVEERRLRWTSTVGEVLGDDVPGLSPGIASATLEQLLSHASGIPADTEEMLDLYFSNSTFDYNLPALRLRTLEAWQHNAVSVPDGSPFQYSNFGYMIAGSMIEKVSDTPWEQLMYERIFAPMGLRTARLGPQATYGLVDAPVGHRIAADGSVTPMLWGPAADVPPVISPSGNANMSVLDYAAWAGWNAGQGRRGPVLVSPGTLNVIQSVHVQTPVRENPPPGTPETGGYGLGWGVVAFDWADAPLLTHNGSNSMNLARIVIDTERDLAVVVLSNFPGRRASSAVGEVMRHLYLDYAKR